MDATTPRVDLGKLESDLAPEPPAEVSRFAPPRVRESSTTLQMYIANLKRVRESLDREIQGIELYLEAQRRSLG